MKLPENLYKNVGISKMRMQYPSKNVLSCIITLIYNPSSWCTKDYIFGMCVFIFAPSSLQRWPRTENWVAVTFLMLEIQQKNGVSFFNFLSICRYLCILYERFSLSFAATNHVLMKNPFELQSLIVFRNTNIQGRRILN
jgi:hypothetical protein